MGIRYTWRHIFYVTPMPETTNNEEELSPEGKETEEVKTVVEKPKPLPPKLPVSKAPAFFNANQFRGPQGNNFNNRQRPGRAAGRGR